MNNNLFYINTNFLIYLFVKEEEEGIRIINKLKEVNLCTSTLTYDEFIWVIRKISNKETSLKASDYFLNLDFLKILELNKETLTISNEAMKEFDLKPRDSLHYASMKQKQIKNIVTDDKDF